MTGWHVMRPRWARAAGGPPVLEWEREPGLPVFATPGEARRAYMERLEPDLIGKPDDFIKQHFDRWSRNSRGAKLVRA